MALITTDRRTLVVGLGQTGLSCVRYCHAQGRDLAVVDSRANPPGLAALKAEFPDLHCHTGPFDADFFRGFNELLVSPGISLQEPALQAAQRAGARISGDIDLFAQVAKAPIVAITGSNGKSTVTTLVAQMAEEAGVRVAAGGNLGPPALELLDDDVELYVLELSSFQLETTENLSAKAATVLNISDDHMDRYPDRMAYFQAKHRIFQNCEIAVVNQDEPLSQPLLRDGMKPLLFALDRVNPGTFSTREDEDGQWITWGMDNVLHTRELSLRGRHNLSNILAALSLGKAAGLPLEPMLRAACRFPGLPHRCQTVRVHQGVTWVNDSKGTNVGATAAALESLASGDGRIILIAGGDGKGADFAPLRAGVRAHCRCVIVLGRDGPRLQETLRQEAPVLPVRTLDEAVRTAAGEAREGDLVLLSPACSSLDMFINYEARGDAFALAVEGL
ncbi:MAG: UDP-N-acetylmuramoyl-L-alanine--D-glutamate ligase [Oleiphilaceae bacterium]|nr:UDP-N-acetylmuramoyl-L-alanine--D-glutamate ligase [Oleiphilaceae bacterium]